jgi:hypothetical protein
MKTTYIFFSSTMVVTQGFAFVRQALYHLNHASNPSIFLKRENIHGDVFNPTEKIVFEFC